MGRPPINKVAMTAAERMRRYRLKRGTAKPAPAKPAPSPDETGPLRQRIADLERQLKQEKPAAKQPPGDELARLSQEENRYLDQWAKHTIGSEHMSRLALLVDNWRVMRGEVGRLKKAQAKPAKPPKPPRTQSEEEEHLRKLLTSRNKTIADLKYALKRNDGAVVISRALKAAILFEVHPDHATKEEREKRTRMSQEWNALLGAKKIIVA